MESKQPGPHFVAEMFRGYEAGIKAAAGLKIGDRFLGSIPEALDREFKADSLGYYGFLAGYAEQLRIDGSVWIGDDGRIVSRGQ